MYYFSLVIPVYNRPDEIDELLQSLVEQTEKDFEVVIVEDGSNITSEPVVTRYSDRLAVHYYYIPNGGPAPARNYAATKAQGEYLLILDSDCVLPPNYLTAVRDELNATHADAFGGPDRASDNFTTIQKAIDYSMTSFFTTGGIRGGKKKLDKFYPRSFNMGIRKAVFDALGGFSAMRFGEDVDFSIRIYKAGHNVCLFPTAWVYHKRRTNWKKFYRQVYNSGIARINLYLKYPDSLKLVHLLPACFTLGVIACLAGSLFCPVWLLPLLLYALLVWLDSGNVYAIPAAYIQLIGYGAGFLSACWNRLILKKGEFSAFQKNFYK
ncbi:glycosyl transferase [Bacteroidia bacterium]|nr:glycosyl transferase [Bacteroidia bacterium]